MTTRLVCSLRALLIVSLFCGCGEDPFPSFDELDVIKQLSQGIKSPLPDETNKLTKLALGSSEQRALGAKASELGRLLFEDPQLSSCGTVSCSSCHVKDQGYTYTGGPTAPGCNGNSARNPPTLLNIGRYDWFMWDLSRDSLWSQATGPMTNVVEMGNTSFEQVRRALKTSSNNDVYRSLYKDVFGADFENQQPVERVITNLGKAIELYERSDALVRIDSRFDEASKRFIAAAEQGEASKDPLYAGLKIFMRKGQCIACHNGPGLQDGKFHNIGIPDDSAGNQGRAAGLDGLLSSSSFNAVSAYSDNPGGTQGSRIASLKVLAADPEKRAEWVGSFKTASLRNLTQTAPYMHTGQFQTLEDVVDFYNQGGGAEGTFEGTRTFTIKPLKLTAEEKAALVDLLKHFSPQ